ncbi:MAG: chloride channel protein [Acidimicrobiales bacterium]
MAKARKVESERLRIPPPLIKRRVPSGRGAMEQPNVTHDGDAALSARFWLAVGLTGVATGLFSDLLMGVLALAERWAFHARTNRYEPAVAAASGPHRVLALAIAGVAGAVGWYLVRRFLRHERTDVDDAVWRGHGELGLRRSFFTSVISEVVVGLGASIGREAAPKLMGGASGTVASRWLGLSPAQRKLLVACGAGAGLAAVYNVPLGGAVFTAEVLVGSFALPVVLPALACAGIATVTAWLTLPSGPTYADIASYHFRGSVLVWSVPAGLVIGGLCILYVRLIGWVSFHRATGSSLLWAMPLTFTGVGVLGLWYPQLFGNGQDMAHAAFLGLGGAGLLFALFALKPLVTAATLGSGAAGGLFTPFLSTGAVLGALLGVAWGHLWPGAPIGAYALVGAAAMIGASMQAPLAALVLVLELTHSSFSLALPMMSATLIATFVVRQVDGYSIYSARLPRHEGFTRVDLAPTTPSGAPLTFEGVEGAPQTLLRRAFVAPREALYLAWTDAATLARWWGPLAATVTSCTVDPVEGGGYRISERDAAGVEATTSGTLHGLRAPAGLAMTVRLDEQSPAFVERFRPRGTVVADQPLEWHYAVSFTESAGVTVVEVLTTYPVVGDRDRALDLGASGWAESFAKLDRVLAAR